MKNPQKKFVYLCCLRCTIFKAKLFCLFRIKLFFLQNTFCKLYSMFDFFLVNTVSAAKQLLRNYLVLRKTRFVVNVANFYYATDFVHITTVQCHCTTYSNIQHIYIKTVRVTTHIQQNS